MDGDVECRSFTQSGQGKVAGSISAKGVVRANGSLKCAGDVRASAMRVEGSADVRSVVADEVSVAGSLRVQRDVTCDKFTAKGGVSINGKLSADTVTVAAPSVGSGIAKCIAARRSVSISAQQAEWFVSMFIAQTRDPTHVGIISGDGTAAGKRAEVTAPRQLLTSRVRCCLSRRPTRGVGSPGPRGRGGGARAHSAGEGAVQDRCVGRRRIAFHASIARLTRAHGT